MNTQAHQSIRLFQLHNKWKFKKQKTPYQFKPIGQSYIRFYHAQLTYSATFLILFLCLSTGVRAQETVPPASSINTGTSEATENTTRKEETPQEKPPARLYPEKAAGEKDRIIGKGHNLIVNKNLVEIL